MTTMTASTVSAEMLPAAIQTADAILNLALKDANERRAWRQFAKTLSAYIAIDPSIEALDRAVSHTAMFAPIDLWRDRRSASLIRALIERDLVGMERPTDSRQAFRLSVALLNNRAI